MPKTTKYTIVKPTHLCLLITILLSACSSQNTKENITEEDLTAKKNLQGTWTNELEGNILFTIKGDTIFYNDSISQPSPFHVLNDTLFIENHNVVKYPIRHLSSTSFTFINTDGEEIELTKTDTQSNALMRGQRKGAITINQGQKIKNDTIMIYDNHHFHAYTQVNPTTYKVFHQSTNTDGLSIDNVYYDNIIHIALFDGQKKIFSKNVIKEDFKKVVPESYISQAVLSEIKIEKATKDGVLFVAILSIPDSYTNYMINILITPDGKETITI